MAASPPAALRASAAFLSALVYWFQWGLHIVPRPSLRLGWIGKSSRGASCASIPNVLLPLHLRMVVAIVVLLSLAHADVA